MTTSHHSENAVDGQPVSYFQHDWTEPETLVDEIVSAVAEVTGTDEYDVPLLYDHLDPESLNTLFDQTDRNRDCSDAMLVFTIDDCTVTIYGTGLVVVQG